jgi:hypothetical protein
MKSEHIISKIVQQFHGVVPKASWGETSMFYNPGNIMPNGVYFCTIKERDGPNDKASNLNRDNIYRLSFGLSEESYRQYFGPKPKRPSKGQTIAAPFDFSKVNELCPHPIYGWMCWVQILSPTSEKLDEVLPLITEAYHSAKLKLESRAQ